MACLDERPGEQPRLPLLPAIAPNARDRERSDPPASTRFRAHGASGVGRLVRSQGLESAGSRKVVTCAAAALLPRSDFLPPQPRRNSEGVVIPFPLPCLQSISASLTKYVANAVKATSNEAVNVNSKGKSEIEGTGEQQWLRNWKERLHWLRAGRAELVLQSLSVWRRTERRWPLPTRKVPTRPCRSSRGLNARGEKRSRFRRMPPMPTRLKPRSKRRLQPSVNWMCW